MPPPTEGISAYNAITVSDSGKVTFSGNTAGYDGGALDACNVTISGNTDTVPVREQ